LLDASSGCQNYACHTPADCFATPQCFGQCGVNQTCAFVGGSTPCAAAGPGYACRDLNATCFTARSTARCPAGTTLAYDFGRRACTSNGTAYSQFGLGPADVRGTFACLGASSCFAPSDAAACEAACDGTPCEPEASLTEACGKGSAAAPLPGSHAGFALVCPYARVQKRPSPGFYIIPLVTSLPLAGVMIVTGIAHALSAEQRRQLTQLLPRLSMGLSQSLRKPAMFSNRMKAPPPDFGADDAVPQQHAVQLDDAAPEIEPAAATT
jgi:hypothetical protein